MQTLTRLALAAAFGAILSAPLYADDPVVAQMGDIRITQSEAQQMLSQMPEQRIQATDLEKLLRTELVRRAIATEAKRLGHDKKPEVVARMQLAADQALATAYMNSLARPPADFPAEKQIQDAYNEHKAKLLSPRRYRVSQIYVAGADAAARKKAEALQRKANARDTQFADVARAESQHAASAKNGGDMGWINENDLNPAFRRALADMKTGAVSDVIATGAGFHILKLAEKAEPKALSYAEVREALRQRLRLQRASEIENAYLESLFKRNPVAVNEIAIRELSKP